MNVLLVIPIREKYHIPAIDLGIGYLATALIKEGHSVKILDCNKERMDFVQFETYVKRLGPEVVGFKTYSFDLNSVKRSISIIKRINPSIITMVGGPHPSALPAQTMDYLDGVDFAFKGEAEVGLPALLKGISNSHSSGTGKEIPGLIWRENGEVKVNSQIFVENLDSLGFPNWDLIDPNSYPDSIAGRYVPIMTTRGCPYPCTYCAAREVVGRRIRFRSVEHIMEEIELLYHNYGIRKISMADDVFTFDKDFVKKLCNSILEKELKIRWDCPGGLRIDNLDRETVSLMEEAGCYAVSIGIESGSQRILDLVKKKITVEMIRKQITLIKENTNFQVTGFCMIGFPSETREEIESTVNLAKELDLDWANFSLCIPLPKSEIFNQLIAIKKLNLATIQWDDFYADKITFARDKISQGELARLQRKAYLRFYLRPKMITKLVKNIRSIGQLKILLKKVASVLTAK